MLTGKLHLQNKIRNSAQLSLCLAWLGLGIDMLLVYNWHILIFLLVMVMVRLHTEYQLPRWPGSASTVCVGGGGWWSTANLVIDLAIA